jgi:hypothetical protein
VQLGPTEQPGRVAFGGVSLPAAGQSAASGSGDLAVFVFRALAEGATTLELDAVHLQYDDGSTFEPRAESATVTIVDAFTPTPPAPTATPEPPQPEPGAYLPWAHRSRR